MHGRLLLPILAAFALVGCGEKPVSRTRNIADNFKDDAPTNATLTREFPSAFIDKDGKRVDLKQYRGKKSVVLVVLRGVPQGVGGAFCLGCLAQMSSLLAKQDEIAKRDAEVVILFPGPSDTLDQFLDQARNQTEGSPVLPFTLVLDKDFAITDQLDIRGDLAKPSTYILDKKGDLVYAYVGVSFTDRPSIKALLAQLDKIQNAK